MPDEKESGDTPEKDEPAEAPRDASEVRADEESPADEDDDADEGSLDEAQPAAIARRVAALGDEDEIEKIARSEEAKLAARRKSLQKKGGKKRGLEASASKRLAKIGAGAPVKRAIATAADADPLIDRAAQLGEWTRKNQTTVGIVTAIAVVGAAAFGVYTYVQHKRETQASVELAKAVADECIGYPDRCIGDPDKKKDDSGDQPKDPRTLFKTADDRREAALRDYREVESKFPGTGAAILARLSEGSLLLDKRDVPAALTAFTDVKASLLARADAEVRGRALEGIGFAYELRAVDEQGEAKSATLDDALKNFRELENTDVQGFKELGMYHQARIYETKGDKAKAIEILKSLHERLTNSKAEEKTSRPFPYVQEVAEDRLRALDPAALPAKPASQLGGPGGNQMTEEQMRKLIEQMQKRAPAQGQGGLPGLPKGSK